MQLRFASLNDAAAIAAIYAPIVEQTAISFETVPPDADEMRKRIALMPADKPYIVAVHDGAVAGYAYAGGVRGRAAYRFGVEVTVYVAAHARRLGVARRLYAGLFEVLRRQGYRRAFAGIALPNAASVALHEAVGFTGAGVWHAAGFKFGGWHDVGFWELALGPLDVPARDPLPVSELTLSDVQAAFQAP
jgi:L-amino acid N-acyltransferase YncA